MARIYLSYVQKDGRFAERIMASLRVAGHLILETPLEPGVNWTAAIERSIQAADVFIVLISRDVVGSRVIEREIEFAVNLRRPIIPILLENTTLPASLTNFQYLDARGNWDIMFAQLISSIDAIAGMVQISPVPRAAAPTSRLRRRWLFWIVIFGLLVLVISVPLLLMRTNSAQPRNSSQTVNAIYMTNTAVAMALGATQMANSWTSTPSSTPLATETLASLSTLNPAPTVASGSSDATQTAEVGSSPPTPDGLETEIAGRVQATLAAMAIAPTPTLESLQPTPDFDQILGATVVAIRATDQDRIAATAFQQLADITIRANAAPDRSLALALSVLATLLAIGSALVIGVPLIRARRGESFYSGSATRRPDPSPTEAKNSPLLETYEVFISSSDIDKAWVARLTKDLDELGYLVWWYAKDAPGLSFGQMIKSAIFYTKVFLVIISPDSMQSKHVEEEIRWADNFGRPLIPILHRITPIQDRLYGLAKDADIDFTQQEDYKRSLELLTQAIDHYLKQRVQDLQGKANPSTNTPA